jgi:hypothetical protein
MRQVFAFALFAFFFGCSVPDQPRADTSLLPPHVGLMTIETAYGGAPSVVEAIDSETHVLTDHTGVGYDDDPHLRAKVDPRDGRTRIFVVGSTNGLLTELSPQGAILSQTDVGDDANRGDPLDVAIAPDGALWVTRYFARSLLVLAPDGTRRKTIDLSAHAPSDGPSTHAPGMSAIAIVGDEAFVALRRLDAESRPASPPRVVVLDLATGAERASLELPLSDPGDHFVVEPGLHPRLWISCIGAPLSRDAVAYGLVAIDPATHATSASLDLRDTGWFVSDFVLAGAHEGYATVARYLDQDNPTAVVRFDPTTGAMDAPWLAKPTYALRGVGLEGTTLFVTDWDERAPGIALFDVRTATPLGRIATRLPPVEVIGLGP